MKKHLSYKKLASNCIGSIEWNTINEIRKIWDPYPAMKDRNSISEYNVSHFISWKTGIKQCFVERAIENLKEGDCLKVSDDWSLDLTNAGEKFVNERTRQDWSEPEYASIHLRAHVLKHLAKFSGEQVSRRTPRYISDTLGISEDWVHLIAATSNSKCVDWDRIMCFWTLSELGHQYLKEKDPKDWC